MPSSIRETEGKRDPVKLMVDAMTDKKRKELFETMAEMGHEQMVLSQDASCGYRGIIAIHSTVLGPAVGGTRFWKYASEDEALVDALRLSRGMTYK
jgi:leucine dehydrogenase